MDTRKIAELLEQQGKRIPTIQVPAVPAAIVAMETLQTHYLIAELLLQLVLQGDERLIASK